MKSKSKKLKDKIGLTLIAGSVLTAIAGTAFACKDTQSTLTTKLTGVIAPQTCGGETLGHARKMEIAGLVADGLVSHVFFSAGNENRDPWLKGLNTASAEGDSLCVNGNYSSAQAAKQVADQLSGIGFNAS